MEGNEFKIVIGSWGSYNSNNSRALGSEFIDLKKYNSWDEIAEELTRQGFELDGIDEELFIQDTDFEFGNFSGDYTHPKFLFELLKKSGVMDEPAKYKEALAYMEVENYNEFCELVEKDGENWDNNIQFYDTQDATALGMDLISDWVPEEYFKALQNYIDFEQYVKDYGIQKTKYGYIEVL